MCLVVNQIMVYTSSYGFPFNCTTVGQASDSLATDSWLTADPGEANSIRSRSHTFKDIDHEIISTVILLPSADSFKKSWCQLQAKYWLTACSSLPRKSLAR